MKFKPGQSGNPAGSKKGPRSGRMLALAELDSMLKDAGVMETLRDGLQKSLERDPVWFFRRIIMPLLPKEATLSLENNGEFKWKLLTDTAPIEDSSEYISQKRDSALSVPDDGSGKPSALPAKSPSAES
ncbi:hypothetical protein [Tichowtungia aerotolerans]|uniref:hypothetical protein n=1 Tax=Tichowtungia aerotolerans TaxID=2697043 RepID=UPI001E645FFD|nr:hypothetical protein [Tichowtungia aerotolerans]